MREGDRLFEVTTARKHHRCGCGCDGYIYPKEKYYSIIVGGGLGAIKFPERCRIEHKDAYLARVKRGREL